MDIKFLFKEDKIFII